MKYPLYILEVLLITMTSQIAYAVAPTAGEMRESRQWVSAKFGGVPNAGTPDARMIVLANNDPAQKNSRNGKPMKIGNAEYSSGLFCHAVSNVTVTLPAPGKAFVATVGVDSNEQTGIDDLAGASLQVNHDRQTASASISCQTCTPFCGQGLGALLCPLPLYGRTLEWPVGGSAFLR